ncbi:MAG: hypothetical protein AAFR31_21420 [Cyanobacteria bacterium J06627_8]
MLNREHPLFASVIDSEKQASMGQGNLAMKEPVSNKSSNRPNSQKAPQTVVTIDPATIVVIISAAILLPLLLTGFISH